MPAVEEAYLLIISGSVMWKAPLRRELRNALRPRLESKDWNLSIPIETFWNDDHAGKASIFLILPRGLSKAREAEIKAEIEAFIKSFVKEHPQGSEFEPGIRVCRESETIPL